MSATSQHRLSPGDLLSLSDYGKKREAMRAELMEEKKHRRVALGGHITLLFENRRTIFYQIMEVLRIEKKETTQAKQEELEAYAPLIPDGDNLKATMLIEYESPVERDIQLKNLHKIEHQMWCQVGEGERIFARADEDMERSDEEKTAAVHFLTFHFSAEQIAELKGGGRLRLGCDHPHYHYEGGDLPPQTRKSLIADLEAR